MSSNIGSENLLVSSNNMSFYEANNAKEFNTEESDELSPYIALWKAVITQALMDAGNNFKKKEYKTIKARAISWLDGKSDDFKDVCEMAGLEPEYIRKKSGEAIKNGCKWRKEKQIRVKSAN